MRLLCIGPLWRGSDAGGLFHGFSRCGNVIDVVDEYSYISFYSSSFPIKAIQKIIRPFQVDCFNKAIKSALLQLKPDILLVYKGAYLLPETLDFAKQHNCRPVLVYPDVSMTAHGRYLPKTIPHYDTIFTTKTFGITDLKEQFNFTNSYFLPHGFDPSIHRKHIIEQRDRELFGCDVSFIGTWSPKKELYIATLMEKMPDIKLKIWGGQWEKATAPSLQKSIQHYSAFGDLYAIAIQCSKINLGILSEQVKGASSGDLITARTFHITGANGFLLHERTDESVQYYEEDVEAGFFGSPEEMASKVAYYLGNLDKLEAVKAAGYQKAQSNYSLDHRAKLITDILQKGI
jgi:spore maturation protein CgeB